VLGRVVQEKAQKVEKVCELQASPLHQHLSLDHTITFITTKRNSISKAQFHRFIVVISQKL